MKSKMIFVMCFALLIVQMAEASDTKCSKFSSEQPININPLVDSPECAKGKIEIQGTVNAIRSEKKSIVLIDLSEENCQDDCPMKRLPVSWNGKMPTKGDKVVVGGEVKKQNDKFLFAAESVKPISKEQGK